MSIQLDSVLTIAIGRNLPDGKPMSDDHWAQFQFEVATEIDRSGGTLVCHARSDFAVGSDGANDGAEEESAVFLVVNVARLDALRRELSGVIADYGQTSACFSFDLAHEPVFAGTTDGYRPQLSAAAITDGLEEALNDGLARRIAGPRQ